MQLEALRRAIIEAPHVCPQQSPTYKVGEDTFGTPAPPRACVLCEVNHVVKSAIRTNSTTIEPYLVSKALCETNATLRPQQMSDASEAFFYIMDSLRSCTGERPEDERQSASFSPLYWDKVIPAGGLMLNVSTFVQSASQQNATLPSLLNAACFDVEEDASFSLPCPPAILPFQCVWRRLEPDSVEFEATLMVLAQSIIGEEFNFSELHLDCGAEPTDKVALRGFVAYYTGMHYTAFFRMNSVKSCDGSTKKDVWVHFDDSRIKAIGEWNSVVRYLVQGKHMPVLLFYERTSAATVPVETDIEIDDWVELEADMCDDDGCGIDDPATPAEKKDPEGCVVM